MLDKHLMNTARNQIREHKISFLKSWDSIGTIGIEEKRKHLGKGA